MPLKATRRANPRGPIPNVKLECLKHFMAPRQILVLEKLSRGEEREHFLFTLAELADRINKMPKTYDQSKSDNPTVYLHYFYAGSDWYITERDRDGNGVNQAFGFAILNGDTQNAGLGYISIKELAANGVELDLHWTPKALSEVKAAKGLR